MVGKSRRAAEHLMGASSDTHTHVLTSEVELPQSDGMRIRPTTTRRLPCDAKFASDDPDQFL